MVRIAEKDPRTLYCARESLPLRVLTTPECTQLGLLKGKEGEGAEVDFVMMVRFVRDEAVIGKLFIEELQVDLTPCEPFVLRWAYLVCGGSWQALDVKDNRLNFAGPNLSHNNPRMTLLIGVRSPRFEMGEGPLNGKVRRAHSRGLGNYEVRLRLQAHDNLWVMQGGLAIRVGDRWEGWSDEVARLLKKIPTPWDDARQRLRLDHLDAVPAAADKRPPPRKKDVVDFNDDTLS